MDNVPMVRAGDVLLVCFAHEPTVKEAEALSEQMRECLPGVRVAYMTQVTGLAVFRPEAEEGA